MSVNPKLLLCSMDFSKNHALFLERMVGKPAHAISFALIENAADVVPDSMPWVIGFRAILQQHGYNLQQVDLRNWLDNQEGLKEILAGQDVIWVGGGHFYYLRWILKETGADLLIREHVKQGKVYAGWSAGAIVAGPTTRYFEAMGDRTEDAPEIIREGLNLTRFSVIPHFDNKNFAKGARQTMQELSQAGYQTLLLNDTEALMVYGTCHRVI